MAAALMRVVVPVVPVLPMHRRAHAIDIALATLGPNVRGRPAIVAAIAVDKEHLVARRAAMGRGRGHREQTGAIREGRVEA